MKKTTEKPVFRRGEKVIIVAGRRSPHTGKIGKVVKEEAFEWMVLVDGEIVKLRTYELGRLPIAGMGGTVGFNGDYYPQTIHKVSADYKKLWASADEYEVIGGPYPVGTQYFPCKFTNRNTENPERWTCYKLRKNGYYVAEGQSLDSAWGTIGIGHRTYAQNPSF